MFTVLPTPEVNSLVALAQAKGRSFVIPEDVVAATRIRSAAQVRADFLSILQGHEACEIKRAPECALAAWKAHQSTDHPLAR